MKAVAYLLDTDVWNVYKTDKADYAIGGPTVEMLMKSYSKKMGVDYQAKATSATGYTTNFSSWSPSSGTISSATTVTANFTTTTFNDNGDDGRFSVNFDIQISIANTEEGGIIRGSISIDPHTYDIKLKFDNSIDSKSI